MYNISTAPTRDPNYSIADSNARVIAASIARTVEVKGADYLARPAGSSVDGLDVSDGAAVADFLLSHRWEEVTIEAGHLGVRFGTCRYFRAEISADYVGQEGIALLSEVADEDLPNVRIVKGHHGTLELQWAGQAPRPTRVMHMIIGRYLEGDGPVNPDNAGVFTWYPGRLTGPVGLDRATVKFTR